MKTHTYDGFMLLSFGGPEATEDVMPFLQNVTRGRGIPPERLESVAEHYYHFGGVSPINDLNRSLIARFEAEFARRGIELPVYWGNRNWHPMVEQTVGEMAAAGVRNALVFATSAYGGFSACGQYHDDIARARAAVGDGAPDLEKLPHLYANELFVQANVVAVQSALASLDGHSDFGPDVRLVFTAHSIPDSADAAAGPDGHYYTQQLDFVARVVAERVGAQQWDLVWQSRSGPPQVPWLAPDINDHLDTLPEQGVRAVVVAPIGFVSDHLEVVWDLDTEAKERAAELGLGFARAATAGTDEHFVPMVVDLVEERLGRPAQIDWISPPLQASTGVGVNGTRCAPGCCENQRPTRPS